MRFQSKTEAYLYTLYVLDCALKKQRVDSFASQKIKIAIDAIRIALENHEQNPKKVADIVDTLIREIRFNVDSYTLSRLESVQQSIVESSYQQTVEEKWANPLGRRFESQLQIELLQKPTESMMASVKKISDKLIEILDGNINIQNYFLQFLHEKAHVISFGAFKTKPNYKQVKQVLQNNNPMDLAKLMFIHFKFAQSIARSLEGDYAQTAATVAQVADVQMYKSEYYKERGRGQTFDGNKRTYQMGLVAQEGGVCNAGLPRVETSGASWVADCRAQSPNLTSPYTRSLVEYDTPYVAGPSGMTSVFIGQLIGFNVHGVDERKHYLSAVTGYMVSGGFHSLHEVLGPVRHCLPDQQLLPNTYHAEIPKSDDLGQPPNFHAFYEQMSSVDSQFSEKREAGYAKLNSFMHDHYVKATPRLPLYHDAESVKTKALSGIKSYGSRSKGLFTFTLNPDKERGIKRADNYNKMLTDATSDLEKLVIIFALLSSKEGPTLKKYVAQSLGFSTPNEAIKELGDLINGELREKFVVVSRTGELIDLVQLEKQKDELNKVISELIKLADANLDKKECYQSSAERGKFTAPLERLSYIAKRDYGQEESERIREAQSPGVG